MNNLIERIAVDAMGRKAGRGRIFDLKVNYISDSEPGEELNVTAGVVHAGRRTIVTECQINSGTRLVATATATFAVNGDKEN